MQLSELIVRNGYENPVVFFLDVNRFALVVVILLIVAVVIVDVAIAVVPSVSATSRSYGLVALVLG